ncbi:MAG: LysR family transcriptional regulator [Proteobacteria bacterium]|nr:LysR family transcriptional regulator [Pseudomonadota bacterium]
MTSSDAATAIRVAVLGEWVPPQLADVLALQRAEEPGTVAALVECAAAAPVSESTRDGFDFALSPADLEWSDWVCEPLWYDTLAVAVAKRSHLLISREVPRRELLKQPIICARSTTEETWRGTVHRLLKDVPQTREQTVSTFDMAMTLVAAGYGITIAPAARLAGYQHRGVAVRPLTDTPAIVSTYLLQPHTALAEHLQRFACRVRSMS